MAQVHDGHMLVEDSTVRDHARHGEDQGTGHELEDVPKILKRLRRAENGPDVPRERQSRHGRRADAVASGLHLRDVEGEEGH